MASFNSDLKNLFKNFQQQQKYSQRAYDANNDGKVNKEDKEYLKNKKNNLLKKENIFDVNGDGKFNQKDIDLFLKGDVNGDKTVTEEEKAFVEYYENTLIKTFQNKKLDFTYNGKKFTDGYISSGVNIEINVLDDINNVTVDNTQKSVTATLLSASSAASTEVDVISEESEEISDAASNITEKTVTTDNYTITYKIQDGTIKSARQVSNDGSTVDFSYMNGIMTTAEKCIYNKDKTVNSKVTYMFDTDGKSSPVSVMKYTYNNDKLAETTSIYYFDSKGNEYLASKDKYNYNGNGGDFSSMKTTVYDKQGNVVNTISNGYDKNRDAKPLVYVSQDSTTIQFLDGKYITLEKGDSVSISVHVATVTRADGSVTVYNASGSVKSYKAKNSYSSYNTPSTSTVPKSVKAKAAYTLPDEARKETIETQNGKKVISYDKNNNVIKETEYYTGTNGQKMAIITKYDGKKVLSKSYYEYSNENIISNVYTYDYSTGKTTIAEKNAQGKTVNKEVKNSHGESVISTMKYDSTGEVLQTKQDKHMMSDGTIRAVVNFTYEKNGHISNQTRNVYHSKTKKIFIRCKYKRDKNNKITSEKINTYSPNGKTLYTSVNCTSGWY